MKEPKLRFPEFTGAWEQRKLGDIVPITMGQSPNGNTYSDTPSDYILVQGNADLQNGWVTPRMWTTQVTKKADAGDLIMSVRAPAGAMGKTAYDAVIGRGVAAIKGNEFIYQLLVKMDSDGYWKPLSCGSTFESLNSHDIKNANVLIPNTDEQTKIGTCFANLDKLIQSAEKELEGYRELKQGMLKKMFPKKGEMVPEIRFPEFTSNWEQRKFEDVVTIGSGKDYKHLESGNVPVYGTGGYMLSVNQALSENEDAVGIGRKGTIDKPYILRAPFWTVDTLFYCIPNKGFDLTFTNCLFQNVDWKKKDESTGVPSLSKVIINNVKAYVPSLPEQQRIGEYFSNLDNLITLQQKEIDGYKELKKGLLQQMFC